MFGWLGGETRAVCTFQKTKQSIVDLFAGKQNANSSCGSSGLNNQTTSNSSKQYYNNRKMADKPMLDSVRQQKKTLEGNIDPEVFKSFLEKFYACSAARLGYHDEL